MYSPNKPFPVWCHDCWFKDDWDPMDYGRPYDAKRPFMEQFDALWRTVPKVALVYVRSVNSEYTNISADSKDCYMIFESSNNEKCIHSYWIQVCRDSVDLSFSYQTELSYESDDCYDSSRLRYSKGCHNSIDSYFLLDCRGCTNCIGCVNLRNKSYHIFNKPVSKEEYKQFLESARFDTHAGVETTRKKFEEFVATQPRKYGEITNTVRSTGNYLNGVKNSHHVFHSYEEAEDNRYSVHVWRNSKGNMDCDTSGRGAESNYNCTNASLNTFRQVVTANSWGSTFAEYSAYCMDCNNIFGSVGLRKKNYCILNKQYEKEEYEKIRDEIVSEMKREGTYGEYFPPHISPFGYNEACGQEQFPLTKEQSLAQGFTWEDYPRGTYGKETVSWESVPDSIHEVRDTTKEIFACTACKKNFRIIPDEFSFYKRLSIPLPRLCPDCRHARRFNARGPNRLWKRSCTCGGEATKEYKNTVKHFHGANLCPNTFETSYPPDHPEIVYCEQCYNAEVA